MAGLKAGTMKDENLKVWTEQVAAKVNEELKTETNDDRVCRLLDAKEYLRRAWHALDGTPFEAEDTTIEVRKAIHGTEAVNKFPATGL